MRRSLAPLLALVLLMPAAAANDEGGVEPADPVHAFLSALEVVEVEYEEGEYARVDGDFLPALHARWTDARPVIAAEHAHEAEEVDEALEALDAKVAARAPAAEIVAIVETIEHEVAEATGSVAATEDFATAIASMREKLGEVVALYEAGDRDGAIAEVREIYIDVYGPNLEPAIAASDAEVNEEIEELLNVRLVEAIQAGAPVADVRSIVADIEHELDEAAEHVATGRGAGSMFFNSLLIIVREGFEAMLVVGALATYLIRTGHEKKARLLYWGAAAGIVASFALWFAVRAFLDALPVNREVLEGVTALLAVAVLFYVSYWLISKVEVGRWNRFIQGKMKGALARGGGVALVGIAFLAVFREGFETVLFYQGLYAGTGGEPHGVAVTLGLALGAVVLAVASVAFYRFGVKLPLRPFFIGTSVLLYYLAFAFTGAGVHELQEAGVVPLTLLAPLAALLALPAFETLGELLGLYPTVETLVAQGFLLVAVALGLVWTFVIEPRRDASDAAVDA